MIVLAEGHSLADVSPTLAVAETSVEIDPSFSAAVRRTNRPPPPCAAIATALRLFALVAALAGLIAIGQAAARLQDAARADDPTLGGTGRHPGRALHPPGGARARWRSSSGRCVGLGLARGRVTDVPDRVGPARRPRPRVPRRRRRRWRSVARCRSRCSPRWSRASPLWRVRRSTIESSDRAGSAAGARVAADIGVPPSAVTGPHASPRARRSSRPHRRRRHPAERDRRAGGLRLQRQRRPPAHRTRAVRLGLRRGDRGSRGPTTSRTTAACPSAPRDRPGRDRPVRRSTPRSPSPLDGTPTFASAVADAAESLDPVIVRGDGTAGADEIAVGGDTLSADRRPPRRHDRSSRWATTTQPGCASPASSRSPSPRTEARPRRVSTSARPSVTRLRCPTASARTTPATRAPSTRRDRAPRRYRHRSVRGAVRGRRRRRGGRPPRRRPARSIASPPSRTSRATWRSSWPRWRPPPSASPPPPRFDSGAATWPCSGCSA